jgi:hypothetical protein
MGTREYIIAFVVVFSFITSTGFTTAAFAVRNNDGTVQIQAQLQCAVLAVMIV